MDGFRSCTRESMPLELIFKWEQKKFGINNLMSSCPFVLSDKEDGQGVLDKAQSYPIALLLLITKAVCMRRRAIVLGLSIPSCPHSLPLLNAQACVLDNVRCPGLFPQKSGEVHQRACDCVWARRKKTRKKTSWSLKVSSLQARSTRQHAMIAECSVQKQKMLSYLIRAILSTKCFHFPFEIVKFSFKLYQWKRFFFSSANWKLQRMANDLFHFISSSCRFFCAKYVRRSRCREFS